MVFRNKRRSALVVGLVVLQLALLCSFVWVRFAPGVGLGEKSQREGEVITRSTDTPDETKVDKSSYKWVGLDEDPKYIELPSIKAEGFIQKVGIDQYKRIAVPNNIHLAGWFTESSKPGQAGLSIIAGHVTGRYNDAVFKNLVNLKAEDKLFLTLGSGKVLEYQVLSIQSVDLAGSADALFSQNTAVRSQLNLITCGGNYLDDQRSFDRRVIVSAKYLDR